MHVGNLMLRRTLLKVPSVVEPPESKILFKKTSRSHGKICKVIVDSSSTENIVSTKMVDKLKLGGYLITHPIRFHG